MGHVDHAGLWYGAAFRLVATFDVDFGAEWSIRLAMQPWGELVVVRSGTCRVVLADRETRVGPGEAFVLGRGRARLTAAEGGPISLYGFGYRLEAVAGGDLSGVLRTPLALAPVPRRLQSLAERAVRYGQSAVPADALRARASAELAVAELLDPSVHPSGDPPEPIDRRQTLVLQTIAELEDHFREQLDLAAVAALVHVSPQHLAKVFRSVLQVTPTAYLRALRLSKARSRLTLTDEAISTIADACGFSAPTHFTRAYTRRYGESPTSTRRGSPRSMPTDA